MAAAHEAVFRGDAVHHLIVRLRHNVIRAGLRRISLAYSRISLADVAAQLGLASVQDTESIVAKAIRWGRGLGRWRGVVWCVFGCVCVGGGPWCAWCYAWGGAWGGG